MSHPIIGNPNEVNGDFFLEFHDPNLHVKKENSFYIIRPNPESFVIENEYFKQLFDEKKIILSWKIYSSKTFFNVSSQNFKEVKFSTNKISGSFEISFCLCANQDFEFNPPKGAVNSFFEGKTKIDKGCIISKETKFRINPNIVNRGGISSILEFRYMDELDKEFDVRYNDNSGRIVVYIKDKSFYNILNSLTTKKQTKKIAINSFFSSIIIEAIRLLSTDEHFDWADDLKAVIDFDDDNKEFYSEFDNAINVYDEKFGNDGFLRNSIFQINKLTE